MTLKEFIDFQEGIAIGEEYSFTYLNEEYWISQNPGEYYEALFENGTIEGRLLSEIYMNIEW